MRYSSAILIILGCLLPSVALANSIIYAVSPLGGNTYRYTYDLSGVVLTANQELDILFDASKVSSISNGVAPAAFDLLLFQPNSPPGADGVYSLFTAVTPPSMTGVFSVDLILLAAGPPPPQQFAVYNVSPSPPFLITPVVGAGGTTATTAADTGIPEPSSLWLMCSVLVSGSVALAVRRRRPSRSR